MHKKVALGLSGGVDSAVSAALLLQAGYQVTGVFMECYREEGCRSDQDRKDALAVAMELGIPFVSLDFKVAYREKVLEYFYTEYGAGRTPNPDVLCNREIKFGLFLEWAEAEGFDLMATGHYADIVKREELIDRGWMSEIDQENFLVIPRDTWKDQTYFLNQIPAEVLPKILFPLGKMEKKEVREKARELGLVVAEKKDSTGVCFVGEINVRSFLKERLGERPGVIMNRAGEVVGEHEGAWFYTIGQRHGLRINAASPKSKPWFVIEKKIDENVVIVGFEEETYRSEFGVKEMNWLVNFREKLGDEVSEWSEWRPEKTVEMGLKVRIRHMGELIEVKRVDWKREVVELTRPVKGVSEGQFAVFYGETRDDGGAKLICLGGGVIAG